MGVDALLRAGLRRQIRARSRARAARQGPDYGGESIYAWDPKQQHIVFWYWSSDGDIDQGSVEPVADGLNFPEHHLTQPQDVTMRTHWHLLGADRYEAVNERKNGDAWQTDWKIEYRRVPKSKGGAAKPHSPGK